MNKTKKNYIREIRESLGYPLDQISGFTEIPIERLKAIESGDEATLAELRDIAFVLGVSTRALLGDGGVFSSHQAGGTCILLEGRMSTVSGFWGHIGILLHNSDKYLWFPITSETSEIVCRVCDQPRFCIPCMNNKVLYVNRSCVKDMILLNDDCDPAYCANWDPNVSDGEIPLVVYESLGDFMSGEGDDEEIVSKKFQKMLDNFVDEKKLSEEDMTEMTLTSVIHYKDGKTGYANIDFGFCYENISEDVRMMSMFEDYEYLNDILYFVSTEGAQHHLVADNVSMLEMPLLKLEDAVLKKEVEAGDF